MDTFEKMYTIKEATVPLGCSRDSVVRLIQRGQLEAVQFPRMGGTGKNKCRRISESAMRRFLDRSKERRR
jgi:excisionase family DNA binding protein